MLIFFFLLVSEAKHFHVHVSKYERLICVSVFGEASYFKSNVFIHAKVHLLFLQQTFLLAISPQAHLVRKPNLDYVVHNSIAFHSKLLRQKKKVLQ